jgi:uncharacterized protein (DUF697 family)
MTDKVPARRGAADEPLNVLVQAILDFIGKVPSSDEPTIPGDPLPHVQSLASRAALKASGLSATLALPPGPFGMATIIPDLIAIWKIQAQMVADIASAYGKTAYLTQEQILYCLFRHAAAQAVRDLVVRVGERMLVRRVSLRVFQNAARKVGMKVTQRLIAKSISRWLPIIGALGVGAYAYYDTGQVAATAIDLFSREIDFDGEPQGAA